MDFTAIGYVDIEDLRRLGHTVAHGGRLRGGDDAMDRLNSINGRKPAPAQLGLAVAGGNNLKFGGKAPAVVASVMNRQDIIPAPAKGLSYERVEVAPHLLIDE